MKKILSALLMTLAILLVISCTNDVKDPADETVSSWSDAFQRYWDVMNLEYVHFSEEDGLDWDSVYAEYAPKFAELDYDNEADSVKAFTYFKEIAWNLKDYHYALRIFDKKGNMLQFSPAVLQKFKKNSGKDINEYPDVYWLRSDSTPDNPTYSLCSLKLGKDNPVVAELTTGRIGKSNPDYLKYKEYAKYIEGQFEVEELSENGKFHGADNADTFQSGCFYEATINADDPSLTAGTDAYNVWNEVVTSLSLDGFSYCYGLTKGGYFYFYLSSFPSATVLAYEPVLEELTKEEIEKLSFQMQLLYHSLWDIVDASGKPVLATNIRKLREICNLMYNLTMVGAYDSCMFEPPAGSEEPILKNLVKGVIMDVRSNGGGAADFLFRVMGSFFSERTLIGYTRTKDGYARYNYSPWAGYYLESNYVNSNARSSYSHPFVVIANGFSVSCSEITCMIAKLLPNSKIVGGTTYGGTCALVSRKIFHSGPFSEKGLLVYTTTFQAVDSNFVNHETKGITPDEECAADTANKDARFEKALEVIGKM